MYNRYIRNPSGGYIRQSMPETNSNPPPQSAPEPPPPPPPQTQPPQNEHPQPPKQPSPPPFSGPKQPLDADDLLIAAILALLLRDGDELDWTSLLAGFLYLFL